MNAQSHVLTCLGEIDRKDRFMKRVSLKRRWECKEAEPECDRPLALNGLDRLNRCRGWLEPEFVPCVDNPVVKERIFLPLEVGKQEKVGAPRLCFERDLLYPAQSSLLRVEVYLNRGARPS